MKWVTRSHVHVDRVACPWLIKRFVDSDAEFIFFPVDHENLRHQFEVYDALYAWCSLGVTSRPQG